MLRRLLPILLVMIFLAPAATAYLVLSHQRMVIRKQVKSTLKHHLDCSDLEYFRFSKQETATLLRWEHAKEFEFKGQMYDVVQTNQVGDSVEYWCWWDHEETKLNLQLRRMVADAMRANPDQRSLGLRLGALFKILIDHPEVKQDYSIVVLEKSWYSNIQSVLSIPEMQPQAPPPKPVA